MSRCLYSGDPDVKNNTCSDNIYGICQNIIDICHKWVIIKKEAKRGAKGEVSMPRPRKCRRICRFPETLAFTPIGSSGEKAPIFLTVDEYEALRLIDKEGLSQEQCGEYMKIARTTVQQIYGAARKKLADAIVDGVPFRIEGGDYQLCDGADALCEGENCIRRKLNEKFGKAKGDHIVRIAVTYEKGQIFQHFGHTEQFKVYDVQDGKIAQSEVVSTNGSGHGALAGVLSALKVDTLICGGIGGGARMALDSVGIKLYGGVSGDADQAVEALLAGNLDFNPDVRCSHHDERHHDGHNCGDHGCGGHSCGEHNC